MRISPSLEDRVVRAASEVIGGPAGRRMLVHPVPSLAVAVLLGSSMLTIAVGVLERQHCRAVGWTTPDQFFHACYSDLPVVYRSSGLAEGRPVYQQAGRPGSLEQPVLTGALMSAVARLVPAGGDLLRARWYFDLSTIVIAIALVCCVVLVARMVGVRVWDAAHVAISPVVALAALVSFDLVAVSLATAGMWAWARRRPVMAGALFGIAIAARTYPVLILLAIVVLGLRSGRERHAWRTAVTAAAAWAFLNIPAVLLSPGGWAAPWRSWRRASAGYGSTWLLPQLVGRASARPADRPSVEGLTVAQVTILSLLGLVLVVVTVALLTLTAPRRPRLAQVALLLVAGSLLVGKAFPVQASLWLVPLVALALPRWRYHLWWAGAEAAYFCGVWLFIAGQTVANRGLPAWAYALLLVLRLAAVAALSTRVVRDIWHPDEDVVRAATGADDPTGGVLDRAVDALIIKFR